MQNKSTAQKTKQIKGMQFQTAKQNNKMKENSQRIRATLKHQENNEINQETKKTNALGQKTKKS